MLCSNCGYENPSGHRYCGMCGTPFPYRALTVPSAQSTLSFTSTPIDVAAAPLAEPIRPAPVEPGSVAHELAPAPIPEPERWPEPEEPVVFRHKAAVPEPVEQPAIVTSAAAVSEPPAAVEPPALSVEEPCPRETVAAVPEAPAEVAHEEPAPAISVAPITSEPEPILASETAAEPSEVAEAPMLPVTEPELVVEPPPTKAETQEPGILEPEPEAPEVIRETAPEPEVAPQAVPEPPAPLVMPAPSQPAPRVVVMPPPRPQQLEPPKAAPQDVRKVHPPPDSLPITLPPASAGMPTFKEIAEASGPPAISPFEPPATSQSKEDLELKEFVANFRWTPPAETEDELTMRSEVPVIDKETPKEFHHPSFDDDVAPPPEAGPHPTGQEFYEPDGTAPRPRFLDIGEKPDHQPATGGKSFLGIEDAPTTIPPEVSAGIKHRRRWLWGSILVLVVIFGGLGFLEGRAQSTHAFRGPIEMVLDEYSKLRERLHPKVEPAAIAPDSRAPETTKPAETQTLPQPQPATTQPESAQQTPPTASPADRNSQPQQSPSAGGTQAADTGAATRPTDPTAKPIEAPLPKPSSKPQPGQQELAKAMQASDSAAAAAWLWKAT
ncbi:MAG TPA: zinc-ribbon domain-containing protein, partial [Bryobacteraceae bacterium]|nr:zinc-ribbon domain-containing protein [Bryobacteraceae bacterium]